MPVNIIDTLKPKNNGTFPIAEAVDIAVSADLRLPEALDAKADASALAQTNAAVAEKASASDLTTATTNLQSQINEIITPVTQDAEVQNARVSADGTTYATLKQRLDTQDNSVASEFVKAESDINNGLEFLSKGKKNITGNWVMGTISTSTGAANYGTYGRRTDSIIYASEDMTVHIDAGYHLYIYNYSSGGEISSSKFINRTSVTTSTYTIQKGTYFVPVVVNDPLDTTVPSTPDYSYKVYYYTDDHKALQENAVEINAIQDAIFVNKKIGNDDMSGESGWIRVVTDNNPIPDPVDEITVHVKMHQTSATILVLRVVGNEYVIMHRESVTAAEAGDEISKVINYSFVGDGSEYIAVAGCKFQFESITSGYKQLANEYDSEDTSYPYVNTYSTGAQMCFYTTYTYSDVVRKEEISDFVTEEEFDESVSQALPLKGKKIACFGDSIMAFGNIPNMIASQTGAITYNVAIGGSNLAYKFNSASVDIGELALAKIAEYIEDDTLSSYTIQDPATFTNMTNQRNLARLKELDFSEIDACIFHFGTNDYAKSVPLDSETEFDEEAILTSVLYICKVFGETYPNCKLLFITPSYRDRFATEGDGEDSDTHANSVGAYLKDYEEKIAEGCRMSHIPCLENYYKCGINKYNQAEWLSDGLHRTEAGYKMLANQIVNALLSCGV